MREQDPMNPVWKMLNHAPRTGSNLWSLFESRQSYLAASRVLAVALREPRLWSNKTLLRSLSMLERVAFWKLDEWAEDRTIHKTRMHLLGRIRRCYGPRLKKIRNVEDRRRLNGLLCEVESRLGVLDPYCRPRTGNLELTDDCNLRCSMCLQSFMDWNRTYATEHVLESFRSLHQWLTRIDFTSCGESLLSPLFPKALQQAPKHLHTQLITNGHPVDDTVAELFVANQLSQIQISIDAASAEIYRAIRGTDGFGKVIRNTKRIAEAKERHRSAFPALEFNMTLCRTNIGELVPLIRLASEIGVQRVNTNFLLVGTPEKRQDSLHGEMEETRRVIEQAGRVAGEVGTDFVPPPRMSATRREGTGKGDCTHPWDTLFFRADGKISTCCMSGGTFSVPPEKNWEEVWDSGEYREFRRRVNLLTADAPSICKSCLLGRDLGVDNPRYHFIETDFHKHCHVDLVRDRSD